MVKDTSGANDRAVELLELEECSSVLEIGFGQGRTVATLLDQGHRVAGVDASSTMVSQARARNRKACREGRADLRLSDGVTVPFEDDSADAAFTAHTIYFMPDPAATLREVARVLRPGSRLVIACRVSDDAVPSWIDPDIYRIPSIETVERYLADAGFVGITHHQTDPTMAHTHWFVAETRSCQ